MSSIAGPPLGSLRFVTANLIIGMRAGQPEVSGRIEVEIHNDSDYLIKFRAVTAGNINGVPFGKGKAVFDGFVSPHDSTFLVSNRITGIPISEPKGDNDPYIIGIYEYDLTYKYASEPDWSRRSARGVKLIQWPSVPNQPKGTVIEIPTHAVFYNEIEE